MATGGGGGNGCNITGVQSLWAPPWYCNLLKITGESDICGRWRLAEGDTESGKGAGGVEEDDEDPYKGGGEAAGVRIFLQIRHSVVVALWWVDLGG